MRYFIFGDIHGNLEALDAVLAKASTEKPDKYICLGDIVGYGADPEPCLAKIRELNPLLVAGNHDFAAAGIL
ncbi:MAG: metallophosphoesterase, partial [Planctomycetes bacterium]|nr:metallophosphoesterase [Planctomycetota bacterium]